MYKHFVKRLLDILISLVSIALLLVPMFIVCIAIRIDSRGPVFFKQKRLGKNKRIFTILKFRTMCVGAYEKGGIAKSESDSRITKVGKFLRRTSIDELPQLFNIFVGQMSIIGPRPVLDWEYAEYQRKEFEDRFALRPGLFCVIDITERNAKREKQFLMDAEYCRKCSFLLDARTFFGVFKTVFSGKGVYRDE